MLDAALAYAARGWRVFPCKGRGKSPLTDHGHNDATRDEAQIRQWWERWPDANVAIATGDGLAVVDVDDEAGLYELEVKHGEFPETLTAVTGGGGTHMLFSYGGGELRSRNGFGRGVDLKADGGYIIAPPSIHPSGGLYAWDNIDDSPDAPIVALPAWVRGERERPRESVKQTPAGDADMARVVEALKHVSPDEYDVWVRVGMAIHHETGGSDEGESLWRSWSSASDKFEQAAQAKKWASFGRGGGATVGVATLFHFARLGGYTGTKASKATPTESSAPIFQVGDDQEVATYLLGAIESAGPTVSDQGALWQYGKRSGTWQAMEDEAGRCRVGALWGARVVRGVDEDGDPETKHWRIGKNTRANVWSIMREERTRTGFFDEAPPTLVFEDVVVMLAEGGGIRTDAHHPSFRAQVGYPFPFARAVCSRWLEALAQWFDGDDDRDDKIAFLQEFAGACLFGLAPKYQRAVILYGTGGNGKSTCLDAIEAMFPRDAVCHVAPHALMGNSAEYYLAELRGARLNVVRDMPAKSLLQSADFKAAVSGEPLMARPIASAPFSFSPRAGHVFGANSLPATTDQSTGFWRRWVVVPFLRRFEVARGTEDLAADIVAQELPGMVAWAVQGAANLTMRGRYTLPASHAQAVDVWASNVNPVKAWIEEDCAVGGESWTRSAALYQVHREWCDANGVRPVSSRKFAERLDALGVERAKRRGVKGFRAAVAAIN